MKSTGDETCLESYLISCLESDLESGSGSAIEADSATCLEGHLQSRLDEIPCDTFREDLLYFKHPLSCIGDQQTVLISNTKLEKDSMMFNRLNSILMFCHHSNNAILAEAEFDCFDINIESSLDEGNLFDKVIIMEGNITHVRHLLYCMNFALSNDCFSIEESILDDQNISSHENSSVLVSKKITFWGDASAISGAFDIRVTEEGLNALLLHLYKGAY